MKTVLTKEKFHLIHIQAGEQRKKLEEFVSSSVLNLLPKNLVEKFHVDSTQISLRHGIIRLFYPIRVKGSNKKDLYLHIETGVSSLSNLGEAHFKVFMVDKSIVAHTPVDSAIHFDGDVKTLVSKLRYDVLPKFVK